ncbi:hypothetical protein AKJ13_10185 [Methylobacterium sp. ARG-1]|nr:hypothetical protein AKJ13_10185 [Methylobacterium sp. ARG-1]
MERTPLGASAPGAPGLSRRTRPGPPTERPRCSARFRRHSWRASPCLVCGSRMRGPKRGTMRKVRGQPLPGTKSRRAGRSGGHLAV